MISVESSYPCRVQAYGQFLYLLLYLFFRWFSTRNVLFTFFRNLFLRRTVRARTRCLPFWRLFFSYAAFPQARVTLLPYWILLTLDLQLITPSNRAERFVLAEYQFHFYRVLCYLFTFSAAFSSGARYATTGFCERLPPSRIIFTALCSHSTGARAPFIFFLIILTNAFILFLICWMK